MLTFVKSLNNNIALAYDHNGNEVVVVGTGIGFKRKKGEKIDEAKVSKVFKVENNNKMIQMLEEIPSDIIEVTDKIVHYGNQVINKTIHSSILLTLSDHLRFAVERTNNDIEIKNPLQWEVPHLYPTEYIVGKEALNIVKKEMNVDLPLVEAVFIALHFVNAQYEDQNMGDTLQITEIIGKILDIVNYHFHLHIDENSLHYSRFIVHLRYFIMRQKKQTEDPLKINDLLYEMMQQRYPKSYQCALKIKKLIESQYNMEITEDEIVYLVLHIERVISE